MFQPHAEWCILQQAIYANQDQSKPVERVLPEQQPAPAYASGKHTNPRRAQLARANFISGLPGCTPWQG